MDSQGGRSYSDGAGHTTWISYAVDRPYRECTDWPLGQPVRKGNMETYDILKDGKLFASFTYGDPSRFGKPFDREIAGKE